MTDRQKELLRKLGLDEKDFEPSPLTDKDRMDEIENAILELAEIVGE